MTSVIYDETAGVVDQRDVLHLNLKQRLQSKRGADGEKRTIDWMRLNTSFTWVSDSADDAEGTGADRFIWNNPMIPMRMLSAPEIFNSNLVSSLGRFERWGPRRSYFGADYLWRISDSTALLSDMYFDLLSGVVQQYNIGFSHMRWPNLSYYIGSRYLRRVRILEEKGSNSFIFGATYKLV